ncbi:MAG: SprT-like domain-containing protein [Deltaproteobacteria bacterium]|nr:SprT-like domain-containing protein [Deltaproteobacteria bacterium]
MNPIAEEIKFQRVWIRELVREHEAICWGYRVDLARPMIEISKSRKEWGAWDPACRTIRISAALITGHSWDATLNVFKHEMAHQIVTDIFGAAEGHGPLFDRACAMIGVPEAYRGARGDAPRRIGDFRDEQIDSENMRMLDKVRKLLSLARSGNENEAFLAMQKANELIEKYNIDRIEQDRAAKFVYAIIHHKKKRVENYQRRICLILKDHFFVDVVYSSLYDATACQTYRTIELLGTVENVRIAEYVYYFLMNQMEVLWKVHQRKRSAPASRNKRSYRLGVVKGFHERLDRQAMERSGQYPSAETGGPRTLSALILAEDKALSEFTKTRFPRLSRYRCAGGNIDFTMFQAGRKDGEQLNLHRGIQHKDGFKGRLLTGSSSD